MALKSHLFSFLIVIVVVVQWCLHKIIVIVTMDLLELIVKHQCGAVIQFPRMIHWFVVEMEFVNLKIDAKL